MKSQQSVLRILASCALYWCAAYGVFSLLERSFGGEFAKIFALIVVVICIVVLGFGWPFGGKSDD